MKLFLRFFGFLFAAGTLLFRQIPTEVSAPLYLLVVIIEVIIAPIPRLRLKNA